MAMAEQLILVLIVVFFDIMEQSAPLPRAIRVTVFRSLSVQILLVYISIVKKPPTIEVYSSAVEDTASGFVFKVDDDGGSYEVRMNSSLRNHDYVAKGPFIFERFDILTSATVAELEYTIVRTAVLVTWDLVAERYVDELESYVEVRNSEKELKNFTTRDYALDLVLDHRPTTYEVKVCTWYVNRTGHCSETGHIAVPELAPEDPPEKISVNVSETGAISVDFLPPRTNKLIGTLLRCTVALCTGRVVTSECLTKTVPITSTHRLSVQFDDPESANVLYASAECYTNGGASPRSVRVPIYTGKEDELQKLRKQQQKDFKINISISVDGGTRSIVRWRMSMGNDAKPSDDLIKEFKILRYRRLNSKYRPQYVPGKVLTTDRSLNEFDDGISPAYKLESRCYWYAVEITLKNGTRVVQKTDEICYSVASPGYLMFFAAEIVCIVVSWFCLCNPTKDARAIPSKTQMKSSAK
ncbi:hypothetical protein Q1695_008374 [Nippostrongylus brasiliensis]|nr:hypothetical protein Q1695_008374 [Nippostrongylus brasiliensis]